MTLPAPAGTPFADTIRALAQAEPDRPALTVGDATLTRGELVAASRRLAARLAELGVTPDSMVSIVLPNSVEFVVAAVATWQLGAIPQPISDRLPAGESAAIVQLAEPSVVIGVDPADAAGRPVLTLGDVTARVAGPAEPAEPKDRPALVGSSWKAMTSGGSTGRPKLIVATQPAVTEPLSPLFALLRIPPGGAVLVTGPLSHNAPFAVMTGALLTGGHLVVMPRFDAVETLRLVQRHRINWLYLVPTMMLRIWRRPEHDRATADVSSLQVAFHMASACPPWLKQEWIDWLGAERILELYGGTELQALTIITGTEWLAHRGSVGRALLGEIECRDAAGNPVAAGTVGELWMRRGAGAAAPYRYIGATAKSAADGWESLGDLGYLDADGYVFITDRDTDMIVVGGSNVYPAEIEAALDAHPAVLSSCVIGLPDEDRGQVPHAIVQTGEDVTAEQIIAHLRALVATYKLPRSVEFVDTPLRDDAGKVRRSALRAQRLARG